LYEYCGSEIQQQRMIWPSTWSNASEAVATANTAQMHVNEGHKGMRVHGL